MEIRRLFKNLHYRQVYYTFRGVIQLTLQLARSSLCLILQRVRFPLELIYDGTEKLILSVTAQRGLPCTPRKKGNNAEGVKEDREREREKKESKEELALRPREKKRRTKAISRARSCYQIFSFQRVRTPLPVCVCVICSPIKQRYTKRKREGERSVARGRLLGLRKFVAITVCLPTAGTLAADVQRTAQLFLYHIPIRRRSSFSFSLLYFFPPLSHPPTHSRARPRARLSRLRLVWPPLSLARSVFALCLGPHVSFSRRTCAEFFSYRASAAGNVNFCFFPCTSAPRVRRQLFFRAYRCRAYS